MTTLPKALYTAAQTRELDRLAIAAGTPGAELMARAGQAAFDTLCERWPEARRIAVLCGGGNNGGDGYVVARLAHAAGLVAEMRRQGTTTVEIKSGYGLSVHDEARSLAVARELTDETTFLG
ncbi:NAD(P)H-hydrate epimerase, partial [uncultured Alcanivorax sp.]|uniref:NAD(P)H-hydrate epimerase n=1 Tax=uncultured Alcanivorax sp. TaxID=191215 RepID=UPI002606EC70